VCVCVCVYVYTRTDTYAKPQNSNMRVSIISIYKRGGIFSSKGTKKTCFVFFCFRPFRQVENACHLDPADFDACPDEQLLAT
jgi:hypothetical protein